MKYILEYNKSMQEYKGLYVTPIILDKTYCQFLNMYESHIQESISMLCDYINDKYVDSIVVKMTKRIQPGVILKKDSDVKEISEDIHKFLNDRDIENRVVYGEGTVSQIEDDIHKCDTNLGPKGSLLSNIGRYTDLLKGKSGVYNTPSNIIKKFDVYKLIKSYRDKTGVTDDMVTDDDLLKNIAEQAQNISGGQRNKTGDEESLYRATVKQAGKELVDLAISIYPAEKLLK